MSDFNINIDTSLYIKKNETEALIKSTEILNQEINSILIEKVKRITIKGQIDDQ